MGETIKYKTKQALELQNHELILSHIMDPDSSPLPAELQEQFNRVKSAAQMLDSLHPSIVISRMQAKYNVSGNTARKDIKLAQELFKSRHTFDWDYWQQWQIKDLLDTIRTCKNLGKHKERIAAHKVLKDVIGEKIATAEDPKRMEKNVFYVQLNNNETIVNIDLNKIKNLPKEDISLILKELNSGNETDDQIAEILST